MYANPAMRRRGRPPHPDILTPREWEVLALLREGLTNQQIAVRLGITPSGAKYHVSEILTKIGVSTREEATAWRPESRPWWLAAAAPVLPWRKLDFGWLAPAVAGGLAIAAVAGVGLLIWGLARTQAETGVDKAPGYVLAQTFFNPDPAESDFLGYSVAAVGGNVLVGAYQDDTSALDAGIAYLFDGGTGALLQTFLNPNPSGNDQFGWSVAGLGDNVLVGARFASVGGTNAGAAYLFDGGTGALLQTFVKPDRVFGDSFGESVAGAGGNVLIGAPHRPTCSPARLCSDRTEGAAYLFDGATGSLLQTFVDPTPTEGSLFGASVAAVGNNVLVGAPQGRCGPIRRATVCEDPGAAYLFDRSTGALLQTFVSPNPVENDRFGFSVAAVGGNILVGAHTDSTAETYSAAAYLFDGGTGALLQTFLNPKASRGDRFGFAVTGVGDNVLVGAPFDGTGARHAGAAYLFDGVSGALLQTLLNPTPGPGEFFGWSLAAMGDNIVVGTPDDSAGADRAGAAYVFERK